MTSPYDGTSEACSIAFKNHSRRDLLLFRAIAGTGDLLKKYAPGISYSNLNVAHRNIYHDCAIYQTDHILRKMLNAYFLFLYFFLIECFN